MDDEWTGEVTPKLVSTMPAEIEPMYKALWEEVAALNFLWNLYLELYGTEENMDVINRTAPGAFKFLEKALRSDMAMTIGRLLDPSKTGKFENLSLSRLVEIAAPLMKDGSGDKIQNLLTETCEHCKPMKLLRDKRIGHNDLDTQLKYEENRLHGIGKQDVSRTVSQISELMNTVETYFIKPQTMFKDAILRGTGKQLLFYLKRGLESPDPVLEKYR